ncbi:MAG: sensor histidine kinase [Pseudomonadota bacterium]
MGDTAEQPDHQATGKDRSIVPTKRTRARFAVSRLTLTIVLTNLISLILLFFGALSLNQYRDGLVESKLEGVRAQAQIIADIMAQVAIDEALCQVDEFDAIDTKAPADLPSVGGSADILSNTEPCRLSLVPSDVREVFNRVWDSFEGRVRIFNAPDNRFDPPVQDAGTLLLEDVVLREDRILEVELPTIERMPADTELINNLSWRDRVLQSLFSNSYRRQAARISIEDELNAALRASPFDDERGAARVRLDENGELVASVSVPIRKVQAIYGIVTAEIGGIDALVLNARLAILPLFGMACAATVLAALMLTATIAQPIRQLATAADKVREGISAAGRARIPVFANRRDEIGELSKSLKAMTQTIYARMEAIESFAADVSHELKNPLTSIRSAVETLDIATKPEAREKLLGVIKKDVARMDRLITDISNASRLDAELAREAREIVDLDRLLNDITGLYMVTEKEGIARVSYGRLAGHLSASYVLGNPAALGQVFRNLIDNARSFSPADRPVRVQLGGQRETKVVRVVIDDDGPGVPPETLESIFNRFYTKRPAGTVFGNNSGLGLAISRQIINAHGGRIWAENRLVPPSAAMTGTEQTAPQIAPQIVGARFIVELPLAG